MNTSFYIVRVGGKCEPFAICKECDECFYLDPHHKIPRVNGQLLDKCDCCGFDGEKCNAEYTTKKNNLALYKLIKEYYNRAITNNK